MDKSLAFRARVVLRPLTSSCSALLERVCVVGGGAVTGAVVRDDVTRDRSGRGMIQVRLLLFRLSLGLRLMALKMGFVRIFKR